MDHEISKTGILKSDTSEIETTQIPEIPVMTTQPIWQMETTFPDYDISTTPDFQETTAPFIGDPFPTTTEFPGIDIDSSMLSTFTETLTTFTTMMDEPFAIPPPPPPIGPPMLPPRLQRVLLGTVATTEEPETITSMPEPVCKFQLLTRIILFYNLTVLHEFLTRPF